ncbi:MAG: ComEA family DNA-binding protein [Planctomycetota bacterium]|jgi:competence protein ComEA
MSRLPVPGTRWFSLSGRELLVLALGVSVVLGAIGLARCVEWLWGQGEITITEAADALPPPARLDVNTARDFELATLPRIGPKTARAIVEDRERNGPFGRLEDLTRVSGVGPATLEAIRPHAMCAPVSQSPAGPEE